MQCGVAVRPSAKNSLHFEELADLRTVNCRRTRICAG
jgi:hypothetical protein